MDLRESAKVQLNQQRHPWELARAEVIAHQLTKKLNVVKFKNILDLGCGDTFLVEFLAKRFPHIQFYAVDIAFSDEMLNSLRKQVPKNVSVFKNLSDLPQDQANFDGVLLLDVIEHIEDEIDFLKEVAKKPYISKSTKFLITVPAYQSLFCSHDIFLGHFRRYTNSLLKLRMANAGFETESKHYFFSVLILPRIIQVIKEKLSPPANETTGLVEWNGSESKTNLIKSILVADYKLHQFLAKLNVAFPGLSNIAVCHPAA